MAAYESRTRQQLRRSVGSQIGANGPYQERTATSATSATTSLVDTRLSGGTDEHKGKWVFGLTGSNLGVQREVTAYTTGTNTLAFEAFPAAWSTDAYELWDEQFPPDRIHEFLNRAIMDCTGRAMVQNTSVAHHASRKQRAFSLASAILGIYKVNYRSSVYSKLIHACDATWDTVDTDVTQALQDEDFRQGGGSVKFTIAAGLAATDVIAYTAISELDLSGCTHVEFWAKSSVAAAAGDFQLLLDDTAALASAVESLNFPALTADTWTYCRVALANPELDGAIISIGIKDITDLGAQHLWIDGIQGVNDQDATWSILSDKFWTIDVGNGELVLSPEGQGYCGYSLLKLNTLERPDLLTADTSTCEVKPEFVVARAVAYAYASRVISSGGGPSNDKEMSDYWMRRSDVLLASTPSLPSGTKLRQ